jgi:hypothetical protein
LTLLLRAKIIAHEPIIQEGLFVNKLLVRVLFTVFVFSGFFVSNSQAQLQLFAIGNLTGSRAGSYTDLSHLNYILENGVPANYLGGLGSAIIYAGGKTFLAFDALRLVRSITGMIVPTGISWLGNTGNSNSAIATPITIIDNLPHLKSVNLRT